MCRLLAEHRLEPDDPMSFLLLDAAGARTDSDAISAVLARLGGAWRAARLLRLVPRWLRDPLYRRLARNRYRWFGRREACYLPPAAEQDRFLQVGSTPPPPRIVPCSSGAVSRAVIHVGAAVPQHAGHIGGRTAAAAPPGAPHPPASPE